MSLAPDDATPRQPIFNLPRVVVLLILALAAVHLVRATLDEAAWVWVTVNFAFIPARFQGLEGIAVGVDVLGGAAVWSFVTYALLHADWVHVLVNVVWLAAFGSPLAWRFGPVRFLLFSAVGAAGGAATHLLFHGGDAVPLVGASAAISAHMAGASRFLFLGQGGWQRSYFRSAARLSEVFTDRRTVTFLAVWFGLNLVVGLIGLAAPEGASIAWEAHVGGFVAGLLLFPLFDPIRPDLAGPWSTNVDAG